MILVAGATGNVGGALVRVLADAGEAVRGLTRDPGRTRRVDGVEWVGGDLNDPDSMAPALRGTRALFLLAGYDNLAGLLATASSAGVERVVLLSAQSAGAADRTNPITKYHVESEETIRSSTLDWTFVRPSTFMTNTLQWVPQLREGDVVRAPFADVPVATIDPLDIAAVAAEALRHTGHAGRTYTVSGPEALRPADRVAVLGRVLGRDLRLAGLSNEDAHRELRATMPPRYADAIYSFFAEGTLDESVVHPTVEQVTGRPPRTFEQWASANADAFTRR
jgi:uncharacterized protein YbjT (DUF2867 family)